MKKLILLISMSVFGQNSLFVKQNQYLTAGDTPVLIAIPNMDRNYITTVSGDYIIDFQIDYQAVYTNTEEKELPAISCGVLSILINGHLKHLMTVTGINYDDLHRHEQYRFHLKHYFEAYKENRITVYFLPVKFVQNCKEHYLNNGVLKIEPFKLEKITIDQGNRLILAK